MISSRPARREGSPDLNAPFCASVVVCAAALLASGNPALGQIGGAPSFGPNAEMYAAPYPPPIGHTEPGYTVGGSLLPSECSTDELVWFRGEFLLWTLKDGDIPPLVTTGSPSDPVEGALGQPGTRVLFGDELDYGSSDGARFTAGTWLDEYRTFGVELSYFFFDREDDSFATESPGSPIVARPVFTVSTGLPAALLLASPGQSSGGIGITSTSRLMGAEVNGLVSPWYSGPLGSQEGHLDLIYGFRYVDLEEDLRISDQTTFLVPTTVFNVILPAGTQNASVDAFDTRNRFYGGQAGFQWQARRGRATARLFGKIGLGATHQNVDVDGLTVLRVPTAGQVMSSGGRLTQRSNLGEHRRDRFSVVPEIGAYLGYDVVEGVNLFAGYTLLYWTNVVRPGDQIDLGLLGPGRPAVSFRETDFWAHGLSLGAALTF